jgi:short-subunit dehydrogenase
MPSANRLRGKGGIINLSSVLALAPEMFDATYSATKAFVLNLSQGLAKEVADKGIRIQAVLPGATRTEIWARSGKDVDAFPADWVMEAGDLVDAALAGFDRGEIVTIPPLADEGQWRALQDARLAMAPMLSRREVAPRYRAPSQADKA